MKYLAPCIVVGLLALFSRASLSQQKKDSLVTIGKASFYGDEFHGQETSSGDAFNQNDFTAAHRTLPFGTIVSVTNKKNGKNVIVRINDRGPFVKSRIIDLAKSAARKIDMVPFGVVPVKIQVLDLLDHMPLNDSLMKEGENWDCFGHKQEVAGPAVYIWSTSDIRHAFYMATSIVLDYRIDSVLVKVTGGPEKRRYKLYASQLPSKKAAQELATRFRNDGFRLSRLYSEDVQPKASQPPGQSAK